MATPRKRELVPAGITHYRRKKATTTDATQEETSTNVVELLHAYDFAAAGILRLLCTRELGAFSATTRRLRYGNVFGDTFFSTCTLSIPEVPPVDTTFIETMLPSAVALVTCVRLAHPSSLKRAKPFVNVKEIHSIDDDLSLGGNQLGVFTWHVQVSAASRLWLICRSCGRSSSRRSR